MYNLQKKIDLKQKELAELNQEKIKLEKLATDLEERLSQTMIFDKNRYQMDWGLVKTLASDTQTAQLVDDIFNMRYQNVRWKLGGTSPETGFDSPSFAAYLLIKKNKWLDIDFSKRYRLRELVPKTNNPKTGDLVFYDTGYTMFYFKDRSGHPFCIGMTPLGIVALEINFGPRFLNYGRIDYN